MRALLRAPPLSAAGAALRSAPPRRTRRASCTHDVAARIRCAPRRAAPPPPPPRSCVVRGAARRAGASTEEAPWLQDLSEELVPRDEALEARAARREARANDPLARALPFLALAPYAAAVAMLLSFVPAVPNALSATPTQALLFMLAVFVADLGLRCRRGLILSQAALLRAEVAHAVWAEVSDAAPSAPLPQGCRDALLASARARRYLSALALAAPMELLGAVLAVLAPHPAPGIAAVFAAQLPLRACAWEPAPGGVVRPVARAARRAATLADVAAIAGAALSAAARGVGAGAMAGGVLFAAAVIWHISAAQERVQPVTEAGEADAPPLARI